MTPDLLSQAVQTPTRKTISSGTGLFQMSVNSRLLTGGVSYVFSLAAAYSGSSSGSFGQIAIYINLAPSGGKITVSPNIGTALSQSFTFLTTNWVGDPNNYPLTYVLGYYVSIGSSLFVVKNTNEISYVSTLVSCGLVSNNYAVSCIAVASDSLGSNANSSTVITVSPPAQLSSNASLSAVSSALASKDSGAVSQLAAAYAGVLNVVNCSVSVKCSSLHRENCAYTPRTCGSCLSGYVGVYGDSNTACTTAANVVQSKACNSDRDCSTGLKFCYNGNCAIQRKICTNNCTNNGNCILSDANNDVVSFCESTDSFCKATCNCTEGYYGGSCSMTLASYQQSMTIREGMCAGLYSTLALQVVTLDVIAARVNAISALLQDITQISDYALANCTATLVATVTANADLAGDSSVASQCAGALSAVLAKGSGLPSALLVNVTTALAKLSAGIQNSLAVGASATTLLTANMRMTASVVDSAEISGTTFSPPQTSSEIARNASVTTVALSQDQSVNSSSTSSVGVALVQFTSNPKTSSGPRANARGIGLRVSELVTQVSRRRRALSAVPTTAVFVDSKVATTGNHFLVVEQSELVGSLSTQIQMFNSAPVTYMYYPPSNGTVMCYVESKPYNVSVNCPNVSHFEVVCSGKFRGELTYFCPVSQTLPSCVTWDSTSSTYSSDPNCRAVSFSPDNTTCVCSITPSSSSGRRQLESSESASLTEFSASASLVTDSFVSTVSSVTNLDGATVLRNIVVLSVVGGILFATIAGLLYFVPIDYREAKISRRTKLRPKMKTMDTFLNELTPLEFRKAHWYTRFYNKLFLDHDWVMIFSPFSTDSDYRSVKWMHAMSFLMVSIFVDTFLVIYTFGTNDCITFTDETSCLYLKNLDQISTLCSWDAVQRLCSDNQAAQNDSFNVVLSGVIVTIVSIPIMVILVVITNEAKNVVLYHSTLNHKRTKVRREQIEPSSPDHSGKGIRTTTEIEGMQTLQGTLLRAARLMKMQTVMDNISVEQEATDMLSEANDHHHEKRALPEDVMRKIAQMGRLSHKNSSVGWTGWNGILSTHVSHFVSLKGQTVRGLTKRLNKARAECDRIVEELEGIGTDELRSQYLLQQFALGIVATMKQNIAGRYFKWTQKGDDIGCIKVTWRSYLCCLLLPCILCFMALYIFLFGVTLGPRATNQWLIGELTGVILDVFLLLPMRICAKAVMLASVVNTDIQELYELIAKRSKLVMLRRAGMMKHATSLIQHFNPACRAARKFPHLDIARLLMSFNDNDFPSKLAKETGRNHERLTYVLVAIVNLLFLVGIVVFGLFHEVLQDIILQTSVSLGINVLLLGISFFSSSSQYLPAIVVAGVLIIAGISVFIDRMIYRRNHMEDVSVTAWTNPDDKGANNVLDCMIDLELRAKPNFRDRWKLKSLQTASNARKLREKQRAVMLAQQLVASPIKKRVSLAAAVRVAADLASSDEDVTAANVLATNDADNTCTLGDGSPSRIDASNPSAILQQRDSGGTLKQIGVVDGRTEGDNSRSSERLQVDPMREPIPALEDALNSSPAPFDREEPSIDHADGDNNSILTASVSGELDVEALFQISGETGLFGHGTALPSSVIKSLFPDMARHGQVQGSRLSVFQDSSGGFGSGSSWSISMSVNNRMSSYQPHPDSDHDNNWIGSPSSKGKPGSDGAAKVYSVEAFETDDNASVFSSFGGGPALTQRKASTASVVSADRSVTRGAYRGRTDHSLSGPSSVMGSVASVSSRFLARQTSSPPKMTATKANIDGASVTSSLTANQKQPSSSASINQSSNNSVALHVYTSPLSGYSSPARQYNYSSGAFGTHTSGTHSSAGASAASPARQGQPQGRLSAFAQNSLLTPQSSISRLGSTDSQENNSVSGYGSPTGPVSATKAGDNPSSSGKYGAVHQLTRGIAKSTTISDKSTNK
jgi:hypothetical protein